MKFNILNSSIALLISSSFFASSSYAWSYRHHHEDYCSQTTSYAFKACRKDVQDDYLTGRGNCINISADEEREECNSDNLIESFEAIKLCGEQKHARNDVCDAIGESRYDPQINPADFVDPLRIGTSVQVNSYMPLTPGFTRIYKAGDETVTVTVTDETIEIQGVTCLVVRDVVEVDGDVVEDTDDWFAQDVYGNVWYFGEISRNYEDGMLDNLDGSWKSGEDGAKAGIVMKATSHVGDVYRQEWALAEAEDMGEVLSVTATESSPAAECHANCLQTRDFTPIEPDVNENKFYAPGIGVIVAFDVDEPEDREELVEYHY